MKKLALFSMLLGLGLFVGCGEAPKPTTPVVPPPQTTGAPEGETKHEGETPTEGETKPEGEAPAEGAAKPEGEAPAEGETKPEGEAPAEGEKAPE